MGYLFLKKIPGLFRFALYILEIEVKLIQEWIPPEARQTNIFIYLFTISRSLNVTKSKVQVMFEPVVGLVLEILVSVHW